MTKGIKAAWARLAPLALALVLAVWAGGLRAQTVPSPDSLKPVGFVNDFAHVLSPQAIAALDQRAAALDQQLGVQVAMVTVTTIGGGSAFDYSYALAEHWGVGRKVATNGQDHDTGILIFIAVQNHKYFTQIGYGMEPYITDADAGSWMRALVPELRASNFASVFGGMLDQIERTLAARMPGAAARLRQMPAAQQPAQGPSGGGQPAGSGLGMLALLVIVWLVGGFLMRGQGLGGWLWPLLLLNAMNSGGGGGGWGGGFGGGGGGFGGFGGGGFGGGGAGGSW